MLSKDLLGSLNVKQKRITNSLSFHNVVEAGAGTGKTRTLIATAVRRAVDGVDKPVLMLAFSNKAVAEIKERLALITDLNQQDIVVKTFHGWCWSIIKSSPFFSCKDFTIIKEEEAVKLLTPIMNKMPKHGNLTAKKIINILALAKNTQRSINSVLNDEYPELVELNGHIVKVIKVYKATMKINQVISFEDIFSLVGKKINNNVDALNYVVEQYSAILIDEAQDTNAAQWNIIKPLAKRLPITVVGDPAQAIYSFRGAESNSLKKSRKILSNAKVFKLKRNYRATPQNVAFTNNIFAVTDYDPRLKSMKSAGSKPKVISFLNEEHEAHFVCESIVDLMMNEHDYNDTLVITRTQEDARYIAAKLRNQFIPVTLAIKNVAETSKYLPDIIAALTVASEKPKKFLISRYFQLFKGVGIKTTEDISDIVINDSYKSVINNMPNKECVTGAVDILRNISQLSYAKEAIINLTRLMDACFFDKYGSKWDDNKTELLEWTSTIDPKLTIDDFLEYMMLDGTVKHTTNSNTVTVVTAHGSKGLQAKSCFLINVSPDVYPFKLAKSSSGIQEERRVFYTAATRAEHNLVITSRMTTKNKNHFKTEPNRSYCFLNDIKTSLYDV